MELVISTDGSVYKNPGNGGWAFVVRQQGNIIHQDYGYYPKRTTNNEMEIFPMLQALRWVLEAYPEEKHTVIIRSDSQFILSLLIQGWGCKNPEIVRMANEFYTLRQYFKRVKLVKVRGHTGDVDNEIVNTLAEKGRLEHPDVMADPALQNNPYS